MECRSCHNKHVESIIPLGSLPLANALLPNKAVTNEGKYNLEVMLCKNCGLAQLRDLIDPKVLFSQYVYYSSNSDTMLASVAALVDRIVPTLEENPFIIEVASNDGYLLKNYVARNIKVLGVDPAENIAKAANEKGIPTLCEFFGEDLATRLMQEGKQADILHANNVMAHVPDINGFMKGIKVLLKSKGQAVIEVPYFVDLFKKLEFDTIYHEHVYYFSVKPLKIAFARHGLEIFDIEKLAIHGGTLRLYIGHPGVRTVSPIVQEMIEQEEHMGLYEEKSYKDFMKLLQNLKRDLLNTLHTLKGKNKKLAAYGASAKGTTLLNFFEVEKDVLNFAVDRSPAKQGLYTPGLRLEIKSPQALLEENIDYVLLLTWNFKEEIFAQQQTFLDNGGKFIIPLPKIEIAP